MGDEHGRVCCTVRASSARSISRRSAKRFAVRKCEKTEKSNPCRRSAKRFPPIRSWGPECTKPKGRRAKRFAARDCKNARNRRRRRRNALRSANRKFEKRVNRSICRRSAQLLPPVRFAERESGEVKPPECAALHRPEAEKSDEKRHSLAKGAARRCPEGQKSKEPARLANRHEHGPAGIPGPRAPDRFQADRSGARFRGAEGAASAPQARSEAKPLRTFAERAPGAFLGEDEPKRAPVRSEWSEGAIAILRARWAEGFTASQIAAMLERETRQRCTRNAVIGKMHRLGLAGRATPVRSAKSIRNKLANALVRLRCAQSHPRLREVSKARREAPKAALAPLLNAEGDFVTVLNVRDGECRFIAGDPREGAPYCGRATQARGHGAYAPFCPAHARVCYMPNFFGAPGSFGAPPP